MLCLLCCLLIKHREALKKIMLSLLLYIYVYYIYIYMPSSTVRP